MTDRKDRQEKDAGKPPPAADDAALVAPRPQAGAHGIASGQNPGGTEPGGGPGAGFGSIGTGGASSGGTPTGAPKRGGR